MKNLDTLPGESNTSIISSIINLVCPQCGGRMSEFQCEGRCRRNWLAEWEWANYATRSDKSGSQAMLPGRGAELPLRRASMIAPYGLRILITACRVP